MAVRMALRPIPRLAQQPVVSPSENARAVAMPWLTTPRAKPLPEGEVTRVNVRIYGPTTAPMMPVKIVRHAATAGMPPMPLAISIDTAAVADLGASESSVDGEAPSALAMTNPLTKLVSDPDSKAAAKTLNSRLSHCRLR